MFCLRNERSSVNGSILCLWNQSNRSPTFRSYFCQGTISQYLDLRRWLKPQMITRCICLISTVNVLQSNFISTNYIQNKHLMVNGVTLDVIFYYYKESHKRILSFGHIYLFLLCVFKQSKRFFLVKHNLFIWKNYTHISPLNCFKPACTISDRCQMGLKLKIYFYFFFKNGGGGGW